jgi:hypothetical protein
VTIFVPTNQAQRRPIDATLHDALAFIYASMVFGDKWSKRSAKPLFIGSVPIAASKSCALALWRKSQKRLDSS